MRAKLLLPLLLLPLFAACAPRMDAAFAPAAIARAELPAYAQDGEASWYGPGFAGRRTANGEIFDPSQLTAAHKTFPFNTQLRVTNLENGRSVVVRINDRGPFKPGRIVDLSRAAADRIGMIGSGTAPVRIEVLSGVAGVLTAAEDSSLRRFDVVARDRQRGELLLLSGASAQVMVRVAGNQLAEDAGADILLSSELDAELGDSVVIEASSGSTSTSAAAF